MKTNLPITVIPAKAGIQNGFDWNDSKGYWIQAFAGMTAVWRSSDQL